MGGYLLIWCQTEDHNLPQLLNATCRQWGAIQKLTTAEHLQINLECFPKRTMVASYVMLGKRFLKCERFNRFAPIVCSDVTKTADF